MLTEHYAKLFVVSILKESSQAVIAVLNRHVASARTPSIEYVAFHPALSGGINFLKDALNFRDGERHYFGIYAHSEQGVKNVISEIEKVCTSVDLKHFGSWPIMGIELEKEIEGCADVQLVDTVVHTALRIAPRSRGLGWRFSVHRQVPLPIVGSLLKALSMNCILGTDGLSPIWDVDIDITTFTWNSSDPFAFRQEAAIYKASRACFLNAFGANGQ